METSGSDRKRQRREAQSNEELDVSAVQSLAAARADPPGQLGNTREATLDSSVPAQLLTANPVPSSSREQAPLISSNTDTQRALARLRAVQPQLRTQLLSAADTTSSIQELMRYRLVKQHQSPPQQHTNIYQQALNGVPVLEDPHQQQRRQASERDILLRLKQESEQLPPVDHMLLHQNTALRPSHPMLGMFMQSRAHQQTNPLLQAQMMQLQGYANQPQRIPQVPLNALSLPLSSVVSRHPTLPGHLVPGLCVPMQNPRASMVDPRLLGSIAGEARGAAVSATVPAVVPVTMPKESGRGSVLMAMSTDKESLSSYQCLIREQIEIFEAKAIDVDCGAQGRNKPIVLGQVGLRCIHCKHVPLKQRARASTYYPAKLSGLYQSAQNITNGHLCAACCEVPEDTRKDMLRLQAQKSQPGGGKKFWAEMAQRQCVYEDCHGLRFHPLPFQQPIVEARPTSASSRVIESAETGPAAESEKEMPVTEEETKKKRAAN